MPDNNVENPNCTEYDRTEEFKLIEEAVEEIRQFCVIHQIPMFFAFAVKNTPEATTYERECVGSMSNGIMLTNDLFPRLIGVSAGLHVHMPQDESVDAIEMDELMGKKEIKDTTEPKYNKKAST